MASDDPELPADTAPEPVDSELVAEAKEALRGVAAQFDQLARVHDKARELVPTVRRLIDSAQEVPEAQSVLFTHPTTSEAFFFGLRYRDTPVLLERWRLQEFVNRERLAEQLATPEQRAKIDDLLLRRTRTEMLAELLLRNLNPPKAKTTFKSGKNPETGQTYL